MSHTDVTTTFHPDGKASLPKIPFWQKPELWWLGFGMIVILLITVVPGIFLWRSFAGVSQPSKKVEPVALPPKKENQKPADNLLAEIELENKIDKAAQEKLHRLLKQCLGILEVKDGEAKKTRYKRAVIEGENGLLTDLEDLKPYSVFWYTYRKGQGGLGLVEYNDSSYFVLDWKEGKEKVPTASPGTIYLASGKNIRVGIPVKSKK